MDKEKGIFVEEIDWNDTLYAPWDLKKLEPMNGAQNDAWLDPVEVDDPPLTETERIELCLKFPCKVELARSNVCKGVERSWPKRIFDKPTFNDLNPKEKRCINRTMVRKAVKLYDKYVDVDRLKKRCHYRTSNTLAPYWEVRYRKNRFLRLKALGEKQGNSTTVDEIVDNDRLVNDKLVDDGMIEGEMTDDEEDDDGLIDNHQSNVNESLGESTDNSQVTVINTGSTQQGGLASQTTNRKDPPQTDLNDNNMDYSDDDDNDHMTNDENEPNNFGASSHLIDSQNAKTIPKRTSSRKRQSLSAQNISSMQRSYILVESDEGMVNDGIYNAPNTDARFNDLFSQSTVTSKVPDYEDDRATQDSIRSPIIDDMRPIQTPVINVLRDARRRLIEEDKMPLSQYEDDSEVDTLDFLSQNMLQVQTSTQN